MAIHNTTQSLCFVVAWTVRKTEKPGELCEQHGERKSCDTGVQKTVS